MTEESGGWDAYVGAVMRIEAPGGAIWVRPAAVTHTVGTYPEPAGRAIYVITAHNPGGRMASDTENALAEARLAEELQRRGLMWWSAAGGNPSWTHVESSAAVIGIDEADAVVLGAEFGQDAIFALTPAGRRVIGCSDKRVAATGWSIEVDGDISASASDVDAPDELVTLPTDEEADEPRYAVPIVEVTVYTENIQTGEESVAPKDYGDYINWVGRREGLLCTVQYDEGAITLHGDGQGGVLISGAWSGPQGPFHVTAAFQQLADADALESPASFVSGAWGPGDVATLLAPFVDHSEFVIDGEGWFAHGERVDPMSPRDISGLVLAESTWELEEDGMAFPGSGESGAEVLMCIGSRYVIYSINGSEQEREDLDVPDDEAAVAAFRAAIGAV